MIRFYRAPRNEGQIIKPGRDFLRIPPEGFPQPAFNAVAFHRVPGDSSVDGAGEPANPAAIGKHLEKHLLPAEISPFPQQALEIGAGEAPGAAESLLSGGQLRDESAPAFLPAPLQNAPAGLFGHALAESVFVLTLNVGLVREVFLHARIVSAASDACQTAALMLSSSSFALIQS